MKSNSRPYFPKTCIEDNDFWQRHLDSQSTSDLNKTDYCRQNQVDYARFQYWIKTKKGGPSKKPLIAVKLTSVINEPPTQSATLCTLVLKTGVTLQINNEKSLAFILDRMLTC